MEAEKLHENKNENKTVDFCASLYTAYKTAKMPESKIKQTKQNKNAPSENISTHFVAYASIPHLYKLYITSFFMAFLDELLCLCHIKYWMLSVSRFL